MYLPATDTRPTMLPTSLMFFCVAVLCAHPFVFIPWSWRTYRAVGRRPDRARRLGRAFGPVALTHLLAAAAGVGLLLRELRIGLRPADMAFFWGLNGLFLIVPLTALVTLVWPPAPTDDPVPDLDLYYAASMLGLGICFVPSFFLVYFLAHI